MKSTTLMNPIHLPMVPPMDLNRTMPNIDRISPFPMELRTMRGVGLFGTRRASDNDNDPTTPDFIRLHQGVDLLAPIGTPVFAVSDGIVVGGSAGSVLLLHDDGFKYLTFYQHMQNKKPLANNDRVFAGQQLGEVADFANSGEDHLHFELRYPFDSSTFTRENSLPVDSTMALYQWEEKTYENDNAVRAGHILDNVQIESIEEVRRSRQLRFMLVTVRGFSRDLFIPLIEPTPYEEAMITSIKQAFFAGKKVRILWRESLFFKRIQTTHARASMIAEVKVFA